MKKPLIVTNIDNLLIKHKAFVEPHKAWFDKAIKKTGDKSLSKWKKREDYFLGVNEAMDKLMPHATKKQKTAKAREWYQTEVIRYIQYHPGSVNRKIARRLETLKEDYTIVLLTTNTEDYINKILRSAELTHVYNGIIATKTSEEPNKADLIKKLVKKYGKPTYYLTGKREPEVIAQFRNLGARIISPSKLERL